MSTPEEWESAQSVIIRALADGENAAFLCLGTAAQGQRSGFPIRPAPRWFLRAAAFARGVQSDFVFDETLRSLSDRNLIAPAFADDRSACFAGLLNAIRGTCWHVDSIPPRIVWPESDELDRARRAGRTLISVEVYRWTLPPRCELDVFAGPLADKSMAWTAIVWSRPILVGDGTVMPDRLCWIAQPEQVQTWTHDCFRLSAEGQTWVDTLQFSNVEREPPSGGQLELLGALIELRSLVDVDSDRCGPRLGQSQQDAILYAVKRCRELIVACGAASRLRLDPPEDTKRGQANSWRRWLTYFVGAPGGWRGEVEQLIRNTAADTERQHNNGDNWDQMRDDLRRLVDRFQHDVAARQLEGKHPAARRPGRPRTGDAQKRSLALAQWAQAKSAGVGRKQFCGDQRMTTQELERWAAWKRQRVRRAEAKRSNR